MKNYTQPNCEVSELNVQGLLCASGTNGSNEDFGKGAGFTPDLFESIKPF